MLIAGNATSDSSGGHTAGGCEAADLQCSPSCRNRKAIHKGGKHGQILCCRGNLQFLCSINLFQHCSKVSFVTECTTCNSHFAMKSVGYFYLISQSQSKVGT